MDYFEYAIGVSRSPWPRLESGLFDEFGRLNLDWRLVAQTESGECRLQGFIVSQSRGTIIRRLEAYQGACPTCVAMNGRTFMVVMSDDPAKNWATQVWREKSRVHPGSPPSAPVGDWPSAGLQHPGLSRVMGAGASKEARGVTRIRPLARRTPCEARLLRVDARRAPGFKG
jgi:hypothetical protein